MDLGLWSLAAEFRVHWLQTRQSSASYAGIGVLLHTVTHYDRPMRPAILSSDRERGEPIRSRRKLPRHRSSFVACRLLGGGNENAKLGSNKNAQISDCCIGVGFNSPDEFRRTRAGESQELRHGHHEGRLPSRGIATQPVPAGAQRKLGRCARDRPAASTRAWPGARGRHATNHSTPPQPRPSRTMGRSPGYPGALLVAGLDADQIGYVLELVGGYAVG